MGVLWEVVESFMKMITSTKDKHDTSKKSKRVRIDENTIEYTTYWDSSAKDIIFNTAGVICGLTLYHFTQKVK